MTIEKIFSDAEGNERIYSVMMSEEELKLFSEETKSKKKLSFGDKAMLLNSKLYLKGEREDYRKEANGDLDAGLKRRRKVNYPFVAANTIAGAALGHVLAEEYLGKGKLGAAIAGGAAVGYGTKKLADWASKRGQKKFIEQLNKNKETKQKFLDSLDVAEGKMSKEEFIEKYGK